MKLSLVVPVYNEATTVRALILRVLDEPHEKEVILVDDGSTDGTQDILAQIVTANPESVRLVLHEKNRGKGAAIRTGISHATGDMVLIQDADLEYCPEEYGALLEPILAGESDVVYGSRFLRAESEFLPASRLTDMETCYKCIRTPLAKSLPLTSDGFEIEPEITAKLLKRGVRIVEVPVRYNARSVSEGKKIGWRDGVRAMRALVRYRLAD